VTGDITGEDKVDPNRQGNEGSGIEAAKGDSDKTETVTTGTGLPSDKPAGNPPPEQDDPSVQRPLDKQKEQPDQVGGRTAEQKQSHDDRMQALGVASREGGFGKKGEPAPSSVPNHPVAGIIAPIINIPQDQLAR